MLSFAPKVSFGGASPIEPSTAQQITTRLSKIVQLLIAPCELRDSTEIVHPSIVWKGWVSGSEVASPPSMRHMADIALFVQHFCADSSAQPPSS